MHAQHGAATRDQLLAAIAQALGTALRPQDALGRLGGETFGAVLPDVSLAEAQAIADQLRTAVARHAVAHTPLGEPLRATVSIGLVHSASMGGEADIDTLLLAADAALYRARMEPR